MNRSEWLILKRGESEQRMDTLWAPIYDDNWGATIEPLHRRFAEALANACPPGGSILDAACGTGKYWPILLQSGCRLTGIDQSRGMLDRARAKFPQVPVEKLGMQEMRYQNAFDAIACIDAMENVFPEDWPRILDNFYRALKSGGQLYFTVELPGENDLEAEYQEGLSQGFPLSYGECVIGGGYHYYPAIEQVRAWVAEAGFSIHEEAVEEIYHHFWLEKESRR